MNGSTWTADASPARRPTPDEITRRAERYLETREVSSYGDLGFHDLQEFWAEVAKLKARAARQAQDVAYRQAMTGRSAVPS